MQTDNLALRIIRDIFESGGQSQESPKLSKKSRMEHMNVEILHTCSALYMLLVILQLHHLSQS